MNLFRRSVFVLALLCNGCAVGPVNGLLYTSNSFAGEFNSLNDVNYTKTAEGCQHMILGLIAFGTAGAGEIALEAGIKRIAIVDHSTLNILQVVYSQYCTVVVGE